MKRLAWICAPFAWKVVRHCDGYTYFENAITGRRRCYWDGSVWGHIDYSFMRLGDVSYGPFGRDVIGRESSIRFEGAELFPEGVQRRLEGGAAA
jgi:hypothetical protein